MPDDRNKEEKNEKERNVKRQPNVISNEQQSNRIDQLQNENLCNHDDRCLFTSLVIRL
ncbi:hypothetical protein WN48_03603 [Eufriesea mexicana]|nr:hypothetical protein WN48_03603 [Eufriesea mexicana]